MIPDEDLYACEVCGPEFYTDACGNQSCVWCNRIKEEPMDSTSNLTPLERELLAMLTEHVQVRGGSDEAIRLIHLIRNGYRGDTSHA